MRMFKTRPFHQWAQEIDLADDVLKKAVGEIIAGQFEANLGGCLYKKRIAITGQGKRGSLRTLLAFKSGEYVFFVFGFAKNRLANIRETELKNYKRLAKLLLSYSDVEIEYALKRVELVEIKNG